MRFACQWLVVAALVCPAAAFAEDGPSTEALARQAVNLSVAEGMDFAIARMMAPALEKEPAERRDATKAALLKASAGIREELLGIFSAYYAQVFTPAELGEIVAFYSGPVGQKLSRLEENKPPEVNADLGAQMMKLKALFGTPQAGAH